MSEVWSEFLIDVNVGNGTITRKRRTTTAGGITDVMVAIHFVKRLHKDISDIAVKSPDQIIYTATYGGEKCTFSFERTIYQSNEPLV